MYYGSSLEILKGRKTTQKRNFSLHEPAVELIVFVFFVTWVDNFRAIVKGLKH